MVGRVARKLRSVCRTPAFVLVWFAPTWLLLGLARLAILRLSHKRLAKAYGHDFGADAWLALATPRQLHRAYRIRQVVALAVKYSPWVANCFPQALVARLLLGIYGIPYTLFFGVRRSADVQGDIDAHAWVMTGGLPVTGGASFGEFTVVRMFANHAPMTGQDA